MAGKAGEPNEGGEGKLAEFRGPEHPPAAEAAGQDGEHAAAPADDPSATQPEPQQAAPTDEAPPIARATNRNNRAPASRDAARDAIAEGFNKRRKEKAADPDNAPETIADFMTEEQRATAWGKAYANTGVDPAPEGGEGDAAPADVAKPAVAAPAATTETVPMVKLTVDGKEIYRPQAEVDEMGGVRAAQMTMAAEARLAESNRIIDEARRVAATLTGPRQVQDVQTTDGQEGERQPNLTTPAKGKTKLDPAKLSGIVEKIQVGLEADASSAIEELTGMISESVRAELRGELPGTIAASNADAAERQRLNAAMNEVVTDKFKDLDLPNNQHHATAFTRELADETMKDFQRLGMPKEDLDWMAGHPERVFSTYTDLRKGRDKDGRPWALRDYGELMGEAGNRTRKVFNLPDPAPAQQEQSQQQGAKPVAIDLGRRVEDKRNLTVTPKSAVRGANVGVKNTQQAPAPRTRSSVVAEMQRQRGHAVTAGG